MHKSYKTLGYLDYFPGELNQRRQKSYDRSVDAITRELYAGVASHLSSMYASVPYALFVDTPFCSLIEPPDSRIYGSNLRVTSVV